jgi:AcrR family transcriptional regulator
MPAAAKTSERQIVHAARRLLERTGELSFARVAAAVGVQAPSLYKRFPDRASLLRAVAREVMSELTQIQERAAVTRSVAGDLRAIALAHRKFAHRTPHLYSLIFGAQSEAELPPADYQAAVAILVKRVGQLAGAKRALNGARLLVSFTHGFVSMELAGAFHLGGNLDSAFRFGIDRLLKSLEIGARTRTPPARPRSRG